MMVCMCHENKRGDTGTERKGPDRSAWSRGKALGEESELEQSRMTCGLKNAMAGHISLCVYLN